MNLKEIINESASSGSTSSGAIALSFSTKMPKNDSFFGGDPASSIYTSIKKHRKARKEQVEENVESLYWTVAKKLYREYSNELLVKH